MRPGSRTPFSWVRRLVDRRVAVCAAVASAVSAASLVQAQSTKFTFTQMDFYDGAPFLGTDALASDGEVRTSFRAVAVQAVAVPEPSSLGLLCVTAGALLRRGRRATR